MVESKYKKELQKILKKFASPQEAYASVEYKKKYPMLMRLYKQEGLDIKRKNLLRNRRRLKQIGMESMFAVR